MATASSPDLSDGSLTKLNKQVRRLFIGLIALTFLFVASTLSLFLVFHWKAKAIEETQETIRFAQFVSFYELDHDHVRPMVNTIQFLRRHGGYSINFDKVEYTPSGLVLTGKIGNPTQLWITSLALNFSARPSPSKIRDKWVESKMPTAHWPDDWNIGTAQTTVGDLNMGSTASFTVTIPNVKQTSDEVRIAVWFSGERYHYLLGN
jgi:hypothetical protein